MPEVKHGGGGETILFETFVKVSARNEEKARPMGKR